MSIHLSGDGWKLSYHVAPLFREGYGGGEKYSTQARAMECRDRLLALGYETVHVWAEAIRWIEKPPLPTAEVTVRRGRKMKN